MAILFLLLLFLCQLSQVTAEEKVQTQEDRFTATDIPLETLVAWSSTTSANQKVGSSDLPANIQTIYLALGEATELPCPSPPTLHRDEHLFWSHSSAANSSTTLVAQAQVASRGPPTARPDPEKLRRESRFKLLGNYSLWLEGTKEGDAGWYWCTVLGQHYRYHNWRGYDISVLRGSQLSAKTEDGSPCSVLLCSVIPARRLDSVTWLEGKGTVRGRVQYFWGKGAALLLVYPGKGLPETRCHSSRIIHCLMPHSKGVSFSLAAKKKLRIIAGGAVFPRKDICTDIIMAHC